MSGRPRWNEFEEWKTFPAEPATLRIADVWKMLRELEVVLPGALSLSELGTSWEGRAIPLVEIGSGSTRVLLWTQMHGDEPTHTAALLDLLSLLLNHAEHASAHSILSGCTIYAILMLNPDGVERWQRHNAQGIDVNRDARRLASPEGRLLQSTVERLQPDFAFNLHNQHRLSAVGEPPQPAAVSLLVPPPNPENDLSESGERAKLVAVCFARAIEKVGEIAISRYRADYMPRAFGESIQGQGVSTVLVEAGNWAGKSAADLAKLHCFGLLCALLEIATGEYQQADPAEYDALPLSNEHRMFDLLLSAVTVHDPDSGRTYQTDIGVNLEKHNSSCSQALLGRGRISEIGDLAVTNGIAKLEKDGLVVPGKIVYASNCKPHSLWERADLRQLMTFGVTTLFGDVDVMNSNEIKSLEEAAQSTCRWPVNIAFVGRLPDSSNDALSLLRHCLRAMACGVHVFYADRLDSDIRSLLELSGCKVHGREALVPFHFRRDEDEHPALRKTTREAAEFFALRHRGEIALGHAADLVVYPRSDFGTDRIEIDDAIPRRVFVGGTLSYCDGDFAADDAGQLLTSRHDFEVKV